MDIVHVAKEATLPGVVLKPKLPFFGNGFLAGRAPAGVTKVEGVPGPARVKVLLRADSIRDGEVLADILSDENGEWQFDNISPSLTVDVVFEVEGYNAIILSRVNPKPYPEG